MMESGPPMTRTARSSTEPDSGAASASALPGAVQSIGAPVGSTETSIVVGRLGHARVKMIACALLVTDIARYSPRHPLASTGSGGTATEYAAAATRGAPIRQTTIATPTTRPPNRLRAA